MNFLSLYSLKNNIPDLIFKSPVLYFSPIIKTEYLPENIQKKMIVFKSANLLLIKNILLFTIIDLLRSPLILVKKTEPAARLYTSYLRRRVQCARMI